MEVLSVQLLFFYLISMAPFLAAGFSAPYSQSASSTLLAAVRKGSSERFDWVVGDEAQSTTGGGGAQGRMQLIM